MNRCTVGLSLDFFGLDLQVIQRLLGGDQGRSSCFLFLADLLKGCLGRLLLVKELGVEVQHHHQGHRQQTERGALGGIAAYHF